MMNFILTDEYFKARSSVRAKRPTPLQALSCARNDSACFQLLAETGTRCILNPGTSPALSYELSLPRFHEKAVLRPGSSKAPSVWCSRAPPLLSRIKIGCSGLAVSPLE